MSPDSPFTVHAPGDRFVPLVLDSPHSGTTYPEDFQPAVAVDALRQCEDAFVDELYSSGPSLGATLIAARFPRSYIDPNRSILDLDTSMYYSLDPVGARIFELLAQPTPLAGVVETLVAEFEIDAPTARTDLLALVDTLIAQKLVEARTSRAP